MAASGSGWYFSSGAGVRGQDTEWELAPQEALADLGGGGGLVWLKQFCPGAGVSWSEAVLFDVAPSPGPR